MSRKQIVILVALGVLVALVVFFGFLNRQGIFSGIMGFGEMPAVGEKKPVAGLGAAEAPAAYSPEVPKGAVETKPKFETPLVGQGGENQGKAGIYEITASEGGYTPSSFTIRQGNIVELTFFSNAGDFDFFIPVLNVYFSAPSGGKMTASFRAGASGTFLFECRDFCPRSGKIQGTLIVLPGE